MSNKKQNLKISHDEIFENARNIYLKKYPDGSPSERMTTYLIKKSRMFTYVVYNSEEAKQKKRIEYKLMKLRLSTL